MQNIDLSSSKKKMSKNLVNQEDTIDNCAAMLKWPFSHVIFLVVYKILPCVVRNSLFFDIYTKNRGRQPQNLSGGGGGG